MKEYTGYVNPFIGTGGHGHTHPGAMLPHGMIQPGPDTRIRWLGLLFGLLLRRFHHQWFCPHTP